MAAGVQVGKGNEVIFFNITINLAIFHGLFMRFKDWVGIDDRVIRNIALVLLQLQSIVPKGITKSSINSVI